MTKPKANEWFTVDKQGLSDLRENADPAGLLYELFQNVADEDGATVCALTLKPFGRGRYLLIAEDDVPGGFLNLADAHRLFAKSYKREHAEKRGRFNVGEKLVLALADSASVKSTGGAIFFNADGSRTEDPTDRTEVGSIISATVKLSAKGAARAVEGFRLVIPPESLTVTINGERIPHRKPDLVVPAKGMNTDLQTADGWRTTQRNTTLSLYADERPHLYEMGIPVVEIEGRWSVSVGQKVPLTLDRDNVPPAYLRRIYVEVANATAEVISPADASETWAKQALGDERITPEAAEAIIVGRFGDKAVAFDPSDVEGSKIAVSHGYTVVYPRSLSGDEWASVRSKTDLLKPAGQVTPSPKVVFDGTRPPLPREQWTPGMVAVADYTAAMAGALGVEVEVDYRSQPTEKWAAAYSTGSLSYNYGRLGRAWFDRASEADVLAIVIHEVGHERRIGGTGDHMSEEFHGVLTALGAKLALMAADGGAIPRLAGFRSGAGYAGGVAAKAAR